MTRSLLPGDAGSREQPVPGALRWQQILSRRILVTDLLALVWGVGGANVVIYDARANYIIIDVGPIDMKLGYWSLTLVVVVVWMLLLAGFGTRSLRTIGTGATEYKSVVQSGLAVLLGIITVAFVFEVTISRLYVFICVLAGTVAIVLSRALWRLWLSTRRAVGFYCQRSIIVGSAMSAAAIATDLHRNSRAGYWIVGACVEGLPPGSLLPDTVVPVLGDPRDVSTAVAETNADTVLVTDGHGLEPAELRALSWSLEPGRQHLIVSPSLTDIAGPRVHSRPVAGLPLIHVETPRYEGADRVVKRAFDIIGSVGLMIALSPLLIPVAVIIVATSHGGLFFSHERIGRDGHPFRMLKFRSMISDADAMLGDLLAQQGTSDQPLFKVVDDPRITPIGRFIRKYSVDEIPQLINVLRGDMSLVGPRPQVAKEVALYDDAASRRLLVRPGMTGLWQVSGRSNLGWDESVRLDLFYVENWSMSADLGILYRTFRAVFASDGAV